MNRIAFGRDNQGIYTDRAADFYTIQYTTAPNPDAATTAWTSIGAVDYRGPAVANPALRHLFSFPTVNATGLRIITATAGTCIDEIELYPPPFTPQELWRLQYFGSVANSGNGADGFDFNQNGLANLLDFILGNDPIVQGTAAKPIQTAGSTHHTFTFPRIASRMAGLTLTARWSTDLQTWNDVPIGATSSGPDAQGVTVTISGDNVTVTIPDQGVGRLFARLMATSP